MRSTPDYLEKFSLQPEHTRTMRSMNAFNNSANNSLSLANMSFLPLTSEVHFVNHHKNLLPTFDYLSSGSAPNFNPMELPLLELNNSLAFAQRRSRCEKRPIPEAQKDEKYYERRKRNNEAAKKSRDARKIREDRIAFRAAFLEQENTLLRAQILTLRDELQTLKQLLRSRSENDQLRNTIF